jgi:hypothetical protein
MNWKNRTSALPIRRGSLVQKISEMFKRIQILKFFFLVVKIDSKVFLGVYLYYIW